MNFCHKMALENKLSRHFIANVHFLLYLRTSALTLIHPLKYHHHQSQFPRSYVRKMLDILPAFGNMVAKNDACVIGRHVPPLSPLTREVRGGLINILHFFKKVLALLAYVHFLLYLRTPPALECIPPKLLSHYAAHLP